ncbi:MAG: HAMP domain-containing sensor histidine kinase [Candidatus Thiodiazotropha sp.]
MALFNTTSWSLAFKLSLTITAVVTSVGFLIGILMVVQDWKRFQNDLAEKALLLSESISITAPKAILRKDYWSLYLSLKNMASKGPGARSEHEITDAMILDAEGMVQAHLHPAEHPIGLLFSPRDEDDKALFREAMTVRTPTVLSSGDFSKDGFQEGVVPLFSDQKYLGVVRVRLSVASLFEKTMSTAVIVLLSILLFVIIGSLLGTIVSRRVVGSLTAITRGLEAVGRGEMTDFSPIPVKEGGEIGRLSVTFNQIMSELAEKKMLEEEIAMSEKLVALGRITAGVAHEVNNPLAGLLNCIDTLRKHPNDKVLIDRYLPVIDQGLHRIKDIVHNLLVGLKIEESVEMITTGQVEKLHDLVLAEIGEREIDIIWKNTTDRDLFIPGKTEQIICNLLKNAVEIVPENGIVRFNMHQRGTSLVIEVSDNGPGVATNIRNQMFDPFFTTKPNGTGLGLWVVYRLVQSMQGVIEVKSEAGKGTTFLIELPVIHRRAA